MGTKCELDSIAGKMANRKYFRLRSFSFSCLVCLLVAHTVNICLCLFFKMYIILTSACGTMLIPVVMEFSSSLAL